MMDAATLSAQDADAGREREALHASVADVLEIARAGDDAGGRGVAFSGRLRLPADQAFARLKPRLRELGFFPLLRHGEAAGESVVTAVRGRLDAAEQHRAWLNLALLVATLVSMTLGGGTTLAMMRGVDGPDLATVVGEGLPFAVPLLLILAAHELGHSLQARRHGLPASLPFFIPIPFGLGTLGAFVRVDGAVENKRALFDVAVGGPIAGLCVAVPLFVAAILEPALGGLPLASARSLLAEGLIALFRPEAATQGIEMTPLLFAARIGLALTALNLLPIGQLDGGHIAYAALGGRLARWVSVATLAALIAVALGTQSPLWIAWMAFALIGGAQRAPLDDVTPLDQRRNIAFLATTALFLLLFTLRPF